MANGHPKHAKPKTDAAVWDAGAIARLRAAHREGGHSACYKAFAHLRTPQVKAAIRKYCMINRGVFQTPVARRFGSVWDDPDFHRRFMEALTNISQL